jgi:hypothetical protein
VLDAGAGIQYEGEDPPTRTEADETAIRAWNYLADGTGCIDWAGLDIVVALLGITDIEGLLQSLLTIKLHRPPETGKQE